MHAATGKRAFALASLLMVCGILIGAAAARSVGPRTPAAAPPRQAGPEKYVPTAEDLREAYQRSVRSRQARGRVYKDQLTPHWFQNNTRFWYRNDLRGGAKEFIVVDAERGTRRMAPDSEQPPQQRRRPGQGPGRGVPAAPTPRSPDGKWTAFVKDHNVYVRPEDGGPEIRLSQDGKEGLAYGMVQWAPDSRTLAAFRIEPGDRKEVYRIESSPRGGGRAKLHTRPYALPGDKFTAYELNLFDVTGRKQTRPDVERVDLGSPRLRWAKDGRHFTYAKVDRGHQRFRLIEVDAHTGKARNLIDEKSQTFIWTAHTESLNLNPVNWLEKTDEIVYASERDGWRHLYLIDAKAGTVKNRITKGEYVVRGIDRIDEDKRQVWFRASGRNPDQDPYLIHHYRVNFDGTGLVALTEGNGSHTVQYSPDRKYLIDTFSRVDRAPVHELRRASDGRLVCALERADVSELRENGWEPPEVFVAKGRDGQTDIWGIICRPRQFDPNKKYPVVEHIYAGPQGSFVPKTFSSARRFAALTDLGFIVVQIDGMGTANRSKAFHDVCWHNLKDAGFPDRILWHQAAARKYPSYDISRVGIYGTSAGGQNATAALLFHPEFYQAAVSACGCHDNRMDKASWNEQWMGYPVGPHYAECSNITNAPKLRGKLLLIVGEMDTNVPPESTLRLADALIKAGKDFELLVVPGMGHSNGGAYGTRRMQDFFVRHLHGVEPPDRNGAAAQGGAGQPQGSLSEDARAAFTRERGAEPAAHPKDVAVPDLRELVSLPRNEFRAVRQRYEADLGSLNRFYATPASPARHARMKRFYAGWLNSLQGQDARKLGPEGRADCLRLEEKIRRELRDLDRQAKARAEIAPLVPFAPAVIGLEEARRRMERVDAVKAAGLLNDIKKQAQQAARAVETGGIKVDKDLAPRAAEAVAGLRTTLKNWFGFYNGYDPLVTWWAGQPYQEVDQALQAYSTRLRDKAGGGKTGGDEARATAGGERSCREEKEPEPGAKAVEPSGNEPDVPDLRELTSFPQSEMEGVIRRYQADRASLGRSPSPPVPSNAPGFPERQARMRRFYTAWLGGLRKVDFDGLGPDGRIDYLLLRNHVERELRRLDLQSKAPGESRRDGSGITGRPLGREVLLSELAGEMVPYTPEELIAIAEKEFAWCEAEMRRASREMGFGDDWRKAVEKVKTLHVEPGRQPELVRDLAREAIDYVREHHLVTVPPLARETWRMEMMSPERQRINPFFTGGEVISVSYPTRAMSHEAKLQSMRGNNIPFARATVHHELIPGHHLQGFMAARYRTHRRLFGTPFWTEGWALYWEMLLYDRGFARTPEDRVGFLFWRMHRCARIVFSLSFHLGKMTPQGCIDFLVRRVGHERDNAAAEVRRSFAGRDGPLYQAAYLLGGLQVRALRRELVDSGRMTDRAFHDAVLKENRIPIAMVRASLMGQKLTPDYKPDWKFYGPNLGPKQEGGHNR